MNASYVLIGSLVANPIHYDRMIGMAIVYLMAVGISAHSLDALAPNRPWGEFLSRRQLLSMAIVGLIPAFSVGLYYAFFFAPLLLPLGIAEFFFLMSYNLELFGSRFHTDGWFAFSWGFLPVIAGYAVQTDAVTLVSLAGALFGFITAIIDINAARAYKVLKRNPATSNSPVAGRLEKILKAGVLSVFAVTLLLLLRTIIG
jgi:4-hydroxybenzoate polyprenyltransferase